MTAPALRGYQGDVIGEYRQRLLAGFRRPLLVAPTGSGKTIVGAAIIRTVVAEGGKVVVLAHRREIITQTSEKLAALGVDHGLIQAGFASDAMQPVQVASIATLWRRGITDGRIDLPPADLLVVDEAHHAPAHTYRKIIEAYPTAVLLGLTATPCRGDGRGLGGIFDTIIECPQVGVLIEQGYLVRTRCYAPVDPDLRGVRTERGDYVENQLAARMDQPRLVGDIVTHWHKFGERRRTVVFAVNVGHSVHIRDEFVKSGVRAAHIDGSTPKPERDAVLAQLASGETEVVSNCMVLTEGWDLPAVGCIVLARPTKQMGLFRQMVGRVLRPAPGKTDAIVLDHSGAVFRHGFVEDAVTWSLDPDRHAESLAHQQRSVSPSSRLLECTSCGAVRIGGEPCGVCGFLPKPLPKAVTFSDGDLAEVGRDRRITTNVYDPATRTRWQAMLTQVGIERGYKPGWAAHQYKTKFGVFPPYGHVVPLPPTPEVRSWVRSRIIAFAKARASA